MTSAREPLRRGLERDPRAGGVLEEQVDDRLAAQRRQLLDLALLHVRHVLGDVEDARGRRSRARSCVSRAGASSSPPLPSIVTASSPSTSREPHVDALRRGELGRFLPTKSARIGQLAVAAVDEHREPHGARAGRGRCERVERGADACDPRTARRRRARRPCRRCRRRDLRRLRRAGRVAAQVVAVHRDVERADRDARLPSMRPMSAAMRCGEGDASGGDAEEHESVGALVATPGSRGRSESAPGRCQPLQHGARAIRTPFSASRDGLKGCLSNQPSSRERRRPRRPGVASAAWGRPRVERTSGSWPARAPRRIPGS